MGCATEQVASSAAEPTSRLQQTPDNLVERVLRLCSMGGVGRNPPARYLMNPVSSARLDKNLAETTVQACVPQSTMQVAEMAAEVAAVGPVAFQRSVRTQQPLLRFTLTLATVHAAVSLDVDERPDAPSPVDVLDADGPVRPPPAPPRPRRQPLYARRKRPRLWANESFGV